MKGYGIMTDKIYLDKNLECKDLTTVCPLVSMMAGEVMDCIKERCEWYEQAHQRCCISAIAESLSWFVSHRSL